jgi:hypothetical protein
VFPAPAAATPTRLRVPAMPGPTIRVSAPSTHRRRCSFAQVHSRHHPQLGVGQPSAALDLVQRAGPLLRNCITGPMHQAVPAVTRGPVGSLTIGSARRSTMGAAHIEHLVAPFDHRRRPPRW